MTKGWGVSAVVAIHGIEDLENRSYSKSVDHGPFTPPLPTVLRTSRAPNCHTAPYLISEA